MIQLLIDRCRRFRHDTHAIMFIPTQQERYSKVARITLLLCVIVPSGIVSWLGGHETLLSCITAFLQPIALPINYMGFGANASLCLSALLQAIIFFLVAHHRKLTPKTKLTICITWGMFFALLLRLLLAYAAWRSVQG